MEANVFILTGAVSSRPIEGQRLVVYQGCGEGRLEFQLYPNGTLISTRHRMCVKPIGASVTDGTKVGRMRLRFITLLSIYLNIPTPTHLPVLIHPFIISIFQGGCVQQL